MSEIQNSNNKYYKSDIQLPVIFDIKTMGPLDNRNVITNYLSLLEPSTWDFCSLPTQTGYPLINLYTGMLVYVVEDTYIDPITSEDIIGASGYYYFNLETQHNNTQSDEFLEMLLQINNNPGETIPENYWTKIRTSDVEAIPIEDITLYWETI